MWYQAIKTACITYRNENDENGLKEYQMKYTVACHNTGKAEMLCQVPRC